MSNNVVPPSWLERIKKAAATATEIVEVAGQKIQESGVIDEAKKRIGALRTEVVEVIKEAKDELSGANDRAEIERLQQEELAAIEAAKKPAAPVPAAEVTAAPVKKTRAKKPAAPTQDNGQQVGAPAAQAAKPVDPRAERKRLRAEKAGKPGGPR